jgi:hypothetical protein
MGRLAFVQEELALKGMESTATALPRYRLLPARAHTLACHVLWAADPARGRPRGEHAFRFKDRRSLVDFAGAPAGAPGRARTCDAGLGALPGSSSGASMPDFGYILGYSVKQQDHCAPSFHSTNHSTKRDTRTSSGAGLVILLAVVDLIVGGRFVDTPVNAVSGLGAAHPVLRRGVVRAESEAVA